MSVTVSRKGRGDLPDRLEGRFGQQRVRSQHAEVLDRPIGSDRGFEDHDALDAVASRQRRVTGIHAVQKTRRCDLPADANRLARRRRRRRRSDRLHAKYTADDTRGISACHAARHPVIRRSSRSARASFPVQWRPGRPPGPGAASSAALRTGGRGSAALVTCFAGAVFGAGAGGGNGGGGGGAVSTTNASIVRGFGRTSVACMTERPASRTTTAACAMTDGDRRESGRL